MLTSREESTPMSRRLAVWLTCLCLALPGALAAHENHEHKVMGTVAETGQDRLEVAVPGGESLEIRLTADTRYERGGTAVTTPDVQVGERVVAFYMEQKGEKKATRVLLSPAKKTE
jgi:hypothetical protein